MSYIQTNQQLTATNILSFRSVMNSAEIQATSLRMTTSIKENRIKKTTPTMSVTFSIEQSGKMDTEILIPIDSEFSPPKGCVKKPVFRLCNAVKIRHIGNPATLQKSCSELMKYISDNKLTQITAAYIATVKEPKNANELDLAEIDVYVGLSPNVL